MQKLLSSTKIQCWVKVIIFSVLPQIWHTPSSTQPGIEPMTSMVMDHGYGQYTPCPWDSHLNNWALGDLLKKCNATLSWKCEVNNLSHRLSTMHPTFSPTIWKPGHSTLSLSTPPQPSTFDQLVPVILDHRPTRLYNLDLWPTRNRNPQPSTNSWWKKLDQPSTTVIWGKICQLSINNIQYGWLTKTASHLCKFLLIC